ncbi:MAG: hypothetical protein JWP87_2819 [Labilithrix sp.]|nr:hypothetical protein [Labilithrix sp.]
MRRAVFVLLIGCGGAAAPVSAPAPAPPSPSPSHEPAPAPEASPSLAKKRTRTAAASPPAHDGTKPKNGRRLNPKDNLGRTVFVRADDQCFVEVATGTELVDCPPAANDPAFDHCTAQIVLDESGTKCFCVTGAGHPRPMPNPTPCPSLVP